MQKIPLIVSMTQEEYDDARCPDDDVLMEWVQDETNALFSSATHGNWAFHATRNIINEDVSEYIVVEIKTIPIPEPQEDIPPPPEPEPPPPP